MNQSHNEMANVEKGFLDTQVSLAPTHVSWLVRWSHFRISNLWSPY